MFELIELGGAPTIIIIVVFVVVLATAIWWNISRKRKQIKGDTKTSIKQSVEDKEEVEENIQTDSLIGTGSFKAMVYRKNGALDFTTIPEPIGYIYQFDTSLPFSGGGYIAKEGDKGEILDFDAREIDIVTKELPEWAWFAINCEQIVKNFWQVPSAWWQSVSMWFAAGMMLILFISFLAVFGG